jgi:hypothetical protein
MNIWDFIPPIMLDGIRRFRSAVFSNPDPNLPSDYKNILSRNSELKSKHVGQRCFILATGSSIAKMDLRSLAGEFCIGLNEFHLHPDYEIIRPKYLVFSGFGIHNVEAERHEKWYANYGEITRAISIPLINICDYQLISNLGLLKENEKYFFHLSKTFTELATSEIDATGNLFRSQGVGAMAIQLAIYMGFREIVLVGFDHDWLLRMFDNAPTHFYEHNKSIIYKGHNEVADTSVVYQATSLIKLFENYSALNSYAKENKIDIVNATVGGMLDVFPRGNFNELVDKARRG